MAEINKERPKMKFASDIVKKSIQAQDGHAQSQAQTHYLKNHVKNLVEIEKTEYKFIRMLKKLLMVTKMDIVGFLSKKGGLQQDELGKIELMDFMSFVAVKKDVVGHLLKAVQAEKMKGKKYKIVVAQ